MENESQFLYFVLETLFQALTLVFKPLKSTLGTYGKTGKTQILQLRLFNMRPLRDEPAGGLFPTRNHKADVLQDKT